METLQYKIIKTDAQYIRYCEKLEALVDGGKKTKTIQDEIELLTLLIEKYDAEHNTFDDADPIELLKSLIKGHKMKAVDLANLLDVSEGLVSDMLNYKKGLSKDTIRILSEKFKLNQEAFNRPYELHVPVNPKFKDARMMNSRKKLATASKKLATAS
jgi:HTH-type transcriptional regulator / antitoxin HigA